jgi:hypothetical protein
MLAAPCGKGYILSRRWERESMYNKRQFVCALANLPRPFVCVLRPMRRTCDRSMDCQRAQATSPILDFIFSEPRVPYPYPQLAQSRIGLASPWGLRSKQFALP